MKKLVVVLVVVVAMLVAVAVLVPKLRGVASVLSIGLGGAGTGAIARAKAAGKAAEDRERDKLADMNDAQVREETRRLAPGVADALDRKRAANADSAATRYRGRGAALVRSVFKPTNSKRRNL